jgi:hypothetical protein
MQLAACPSFLTPTSVHKFRGHEKIVFINKVVGDNLLSKEVPLIGPWHVQVRERVLFVCTFLSSSIAFDT